MYDLNLGRGLNRQTLNNLPKTENEYLNLLISTRLIDKLFHLLKKENEPFKVLISTQG